METLTKKTLLTGKEAAAYLGLSVFTLDRWRSDKTSRLPKLPYLKFGKAVRYRVEDLDAFMLASLQTGE